MGFSESTIQRVWLKGKVVPGYDADVYRKDECGAWMSMSQYGNRNSSLGWEIHHILPESQGGTDDISNLIPLHWENNASTGDGELKCAVTSNGNRNVKISVFQNF